MPSAVSNFWIDWLGYLWYGPMASGCYKRFEGIDPVTMKKLWREYRYDPTLKLWRCPFLRAKARVDLYVHEAKKRSAG